MTRPIDSFSQVRSEFDRVWLELAELRQSLNARPIAPTPDYRSDLPADEPCSCEESERLKAELGEAQVRLQSAENEMRRLGYGVEDIVCFGIAGTPLCMSHVGDLSWDTIENKRATVKWINERARVEKDLRAQLAAANALLGRIGVWADEYGPALVPHGGSADTFGDGVRRCKLQVKALLGDHG